MIKFLGVFVDCLPTRFLFRTLISLDNVILSRIIRQSATANIHIIAAVPMSLDFSASPGSMTIATSCCRKKQMPVILKITQIYGYFLKKYFVS